MYHVYFYLCQLDFRIAFDNKIYLHNLLLDLNFLCKVGISDKGNYLYIRHDQYWQVLIAQIA